MVFKDTIEKLLFQNYIHKNVINSLRGKDQQTYQFFRRKGRGYTT